MPINPLDIQLEFLPDMSRGGVHFLIRSMNEKTAKALPQWTHIPATASAHLLRQIGPRVGVPLETHVTSHVFAVEVVLELLGFHLLHPRIQHPVS